jgi:CubicO group peptidase (beta-lactamase class C family)
MTSTTTRIDDVLRAAVDAGDVHGLVATAANRSGPIYRGAAGVRTAGGQAEMTTDTMFRIASMTKMVTTTAALQLHERGRLDLDTPVAELLPEFDDLQVLEGIDGEAPRLRPAAGRATVRQLITHTSGLSYWFWNADIDRWQELTGTPDILSGSAAAFGAPLVTDPGSRFEYGINTDWLGRVVETVSGRTLDAYWQANVFDPLDMRDTTVRMTDEQRSRSTPVHLRDDAGSPVPSDIDWEQQPTFWAGGHCLYSTPLDYLRFQQMLLGGGELDGERILQRSTVDAAFTDQLGDLEFPARIRTARPDLSADFVTGPGWKWGYGLLLSTAPQPGMRAPGSGSWAGIYNTHFWVDPAGGITAALYAQSLPFVEPRVYRPYRDFERALYASLRDTAR